MKRWVADREIERVFDASGIDELLDGPPEEAGLRYAVLREAVRGEGGRCFDALCRIAARRRVTPDYLIDRAVVLSTDVDTRRASDLYRVLGVLPLASPGEIRAQWREVAKASHPDAAGGSGARFQAIKAAYDVLGVPRLRVEYEQRWRLEFSPIERACTVARTLDVRGYPSPGTMVRRALGVLSGHARPRPPRRAELESPVPGASERDESSVPPGPAEPSPEQQTHMAPASGEEAPPPAVPEPVLVSPHRLRTNGTPVASPGVSQGNEAGLNGSHEASVPDTIPADAPPDTEPHAPPVPGNDIARDLDDGPQGTPRSAPSRLQEVPMHDMLRKRGSLFDAVHGIEQRLGGSGPDGMSVVARKFEQLHGALQTIAIEEIDATLEDIERARQELDAMTRDLTRLRQLKASLGDRRVAGTF